MLLFCIILKRKVSYHFIRCLFFDKSFDDAIIVVIFFRKTMLSKQYFKKCTKEELTELEKK